MNYLDRVDALLRELALRDRLRALQPPARCELDFSTNDYLALATDARVVAALTAARRAGAGAARLLGGRHAEHIRLEAELAEFTGREAALVFSSGYLAAAGAAASLTMVCTAVYSDALNHASLIDGLRAAPIRHVHPHGALP
ncbi:MAG: aminotransferase class I/II-fold pyridoxal phosphate-dependent enzyme, partial [Candidatus Eremiobacteraeota bacterium]|nr:aminotransferase class I/II-fold pyridoxal phosphate-dependent enzyme [Candidatus Eremiobacteraeota bacterium]